MYGSFAVRLADSTTPTQMALTQVATAKPTGWAPTNLDPLTFIGDSMWTDVSISVNAVINGSHAGTTNAASQSRSRSTDPPPPPPQPPYVRICASGCGDTCLRGLSYGCSDGCCFRVSVGGNWTLGGGGGRGAPKPLSGTIAGFKDTWHKVDVQVKAGAISASFDGAKLGSVAGSCVPPSPIVFPGHGMVGLGCGSYHYCQFDDFALTAK